MSMKMQGEIKALQKDVQELRALVAEIERRVAMKSDPPPAEIQGVMHRRPRQPKITLDGEV